MRNVVVVTIIIACLAVAYYFGVVLPKTLDFAMQEKCAKHAQEYFNKQGFLPAQGSYVNYECHHNKRLNKCFILISTTDYLDDRKTRAETRTLTDINSNKVYGTYSGQNSQYEVWMIDNKMCSSNGWYTRVKFYMEE